MAAAVSNSGLDAEMAALGERDQRERRERLRRAKGMAAQLAGISLEALLIGWGQVAAFYRWADVLKEARRAQLDIDEVSIRKRIVAARRRRDRAVDAFSTANTADYLKAHQAYDRARLLEERLEAEMDRIWAERLK